MLTIYAGPVPAPLLVSLHSPNVSSVAVFAAFTATGIWIPRRASSSAWRWATCLASLIATVQLAGLSLRTNGALVAPLLNTDRIAWVIVHWFGTGWMAAASLAALVHAADRYSDPQTGTLTNRGRKVDRLIASLRSPGRRSRLTGLSVVMGVLVVSRPPYVLIGWPGIVFSTPSAATPTPAAPICGTRTNRSVLPC